MNHQQKILKALRGAGAAGCTRGQLIGLLYGAVANRRPNDTDAVIKVEVSCLRRAGHNIPAYPKRHKYILLERGAKLPITAELEDILTARELLIYQTLRANKMSGPDLARKIYDGEPTQYRRNCIYIIIGRLNRKLKPYNKRVMPRPYRIEYV